MPPEEKFVALSVIILKYIPNRFEPKYNELVEEGDGSRRLRTNTLA